jgi:hypothetical protein
VHINDIPYTENDLNINISTYADDTTISVPSGRLDIAAATLEKAISLQPRQIPR